MKKRILILVSNSFFVRNFLRSGFAGKLIASGLEPVFLAPAEKLSYYREQFSQEGVMFDVLPEPADPRLEKFFKKLESYSVHSSFVRLIHWHFLTREKSKDWFLTRPFFFLIRLLLWQLGALAVYRSFIRFCYDVFRDEAVAQVIANHQPAILFCPSINLGNEWAFLREAKRLGVLTIGMTSSWDNFYSKTFLRVPPDHLLVQTNLMKAQAQRLADYPAEKIIVVGVPQYDRYFKKVGLIDREEFFRQIGADPKKKLILFACSGKVTYEEDKKIIGLIYQLINSGLLSRDLQVLVRPHPKRPFSEKFLEEIRRRYGFLAIMPAKKLTTARDPWEFDEAAIFLLTNTLAHVDLVITTCTTLFVEAAIFDKPLIAIGFDLTKKRFYSNSARRFFEWDHLADLLKTGGVSLVTSVAEFAETIEKYLAEPAYLAAGRRRLVAEQAVFTDGQSVDRVVEVIDSLAARLE
jgi:hypothetical protein